MVTFITKSGKVVTKTYVQLFFIGLNKLTAVEVVTMLFLIGIAVILSTYFIFYWGIVQ